MAQITLISDVMMANAFFNENILFFGAATMSSAHISPDIKLMLVVLEITVNYTIFAFQDCFPPVSLSSRPHKEVIKSKQKNLTDF